MSERVYFRVGQNSPVMGVINDAAQRQTAFHEAMVALKKELGATEVWTAGGAMFTGAEFPGDPPQGWRKSAKHCVPDKRIKVGREIAKRMEALPQGVDGWILSGMFSKVLGTDCTHWSHGSHVAFTVYEKHGDVFVLSTPAELKLNPPGCDELKMSDYWKIKEDAQTRTDTRTERG